jgi:hypothetical protein
MKKTITLSIVAIALSAFVASDSAAQDPALRGSGGYGMAGCGLGSMLLGSKPGFVQVFAATTNGTFGTQTFGITFGTSNCTEQAGGALGAMSFVETNRSVVAKDIARGSGETIATLATIGGCADQKAVGARLQGEYTSIFPSSGVSDRQVGQNVISVLQSDAGLRCTKL